MTKRKRLVGLLGGTFDPVHQSHIAIAQHVLDTYPVDGVQCMPNALSPHHKVVQASDDHRLRMLEIAIEKMPGITINSIELEHNRQSRTVTTMRLLNQQCPDITWCFIIGVDAFNALNSWHEWEAMTDLCHLIVVGRYDRHLQRAPWQAALLQQRQLHDVSQLSSDECGHIVLDSLTPIDYSSTLIKACFRQQCSVMGLPDGVADYIRSHHLYGS